MKRFVVTLLLMVGFCLVGCGSNSNSSNINGTWNATLLDANQATIFNFGTSLMVNGNGSLTITNFKFSTSEPCFASGETESGSFTATGNFNGQVTGQFNFMVQSLSPAMNTLTLSGKASGNTISGTWTLTGGPGCTGSGSFTMTKM